MNGFTSPRNSLRPKPRSQRSSSISNDRTSLAVVSLACPPAVEPEPAYIAPSYASRLVTGYQELISDDDEQARAATSAATNILVAPNALLLLNAFLDQLLYSILVASRSTSIALLRPAVTEVLKPGLAKDAIAEANTQLKDFDGDNDELSAFHQELEFKAGWDLNRTWRKTRLRCMVFTEFGDLSEDEEEQWLQREDIAIGADGQHRLSRDLGVVSPPAAIFLTSILEYIAERVLFLSAEAACTRFEARQRHDRHGLPTLSAAQLSVEVVDVEKLAVNTTFGRLWRSWKKKVRSPGITSHRRSSYEYSLRPGSSLSVSDPRSREPSVGEEKDHRQTHEARPGVATTGNPESVQEAAAIPLPTTTYDAREIEGLEFPWQNSRRDMMERPHSVLLSSDSYQTLDQYDDNRSWGPSRELLQRNRSSSLPPVAYGQYLDPQQNLYSHPREGMFSNDSRAYPPGLSRDESNASAIMTMYDGAIAREEGAMDDEQGYMNNSSRPQLERYDTDDQNLDKGLDFLTRPSFDSDENGMDPAMLESGNPRPIDNESQDSTNQYPVKGNQVEIPYYSRTQPRGVEVQLDSSRMQGHTTENVSLGNRETSIVETQPPQTSENRDVVRDFPVGRAIRSYDEGNDHVPITLGASNSFGNRFDGTSHVQPAQTNGSTPRSLSKMPANRAGAAASPSPAFPQAKPSVKLSEFRKQLPPVSTGVERASVQRVPSSPGGALESPVGRTSTSSSRELRHINTSGSITSQTASKSKVLGARGSSDTSRQYAISRRSSEASNTLATPLVKTPEVDETQRSFEQLIKSDETIQYTLTPQSVREDSLDSPRDSHSHSRTGTADLADFMRTTGPPAAESGRPATSRSIVSLKGLNGLRSNPTASPKTAGMHTRAPSQEMKQYSTPATARLAKGAPRHAQYDSEPTHDFADFIRSTGPPDVSVSDPRGEIDMGVAPSTNKPRPTTAMSPEQRTTSAASTGKKITKPNPGLSKSPSPVAPRNPPPKRPASKLQAREATYGPTHNSDLLNFLNEGPVEGPGISKVSASAASTSPHNPKVPTKLRDRFSDQTQSSVASTLDSAWANRSIRSMNSRTGLLDSSRGSTGGLSPPLSQKQFRFEDPRQAARKQRRVKDPYAIDTDSEEEGHLKTPKADPQLNMMDFLSSTPPLSDPKPIIPSAFDDIPNPTARSNNINKKANDRYNQRNARTGASATPGIRSANPAPTSSPQQPSRGRPTNTAAPSATAPQLPPLNLSTYTPSSSATNGMNGQRTNKPIARTENDDLQDKYKLRELAEFLKNSEPPMVASTDDKDVEGKGIWGRFKKRKQR
ncbi:MAG: hypothetical protein Q9221_002791 [Calogaya cf. arnoldii]